MIGRHLCSRALLLICDVPWSNSMAKGGRKTSARLPVLLGRLAHSALLFWQADGRGLRAPESGAISGEALASPAALTPSSPLCRRGCPLRVGGDVARDFALVHGAGCDSHRRDWSSMRRRCARRATRGVAMPARGAAIVAVGRSAYAAGASGSEEGRACTIQGPAPVSPLPTFAGRPGRFDGPSDPCAGWRLARSTGCRVRARRRCRPGALLSAPSR